MLQGKEDEMEWNKNYSAGKCELLESKQPFILDCSALGFLV
jgi:hypothetical protein